jgi:hypothetical protein
MPARQVVFRGWRCRIDRGTYGATQRIALQLTDCADGEPVAVATVHMPDISLAPDEVVIKDYSENEGMLDTLVAAGVISPPLCTIPLQYVTLYVCRCLIPDPGGLL